MTDDIIRRDVELAFRLAVSGASINTIAMALGISRKEVQQLSEHNPELQQAIDKGRSSGIGEALSNLHRLATTSDDVGAIKYYLGVQGMEYRTDKAAVEITNDNRQITLPTLEEARRIIMNDPALIDEPSKE